MHAFLDPFVRPVEHWDSLSPSPATLTSSCICCFMKMPVRNKIKRWPHSCETLSRRPVMGHQVAAINLSLAAWSASRKYNSSLDSAFIFPRECAAGCDAFTTYDRVWTAASRETTKWVKDITHQINFNDFFGVWPFDPLLDNNNHLTWKRNTEEMPCNDKNKMFNDWLNYNLKSKIISSKITVFTVWFCVK